MELLNVPMVAIEIADRFRKDFGDVADLAKDIQDQGLISPIALKDLGDGTFRLLAGERRLRACLSLRHETIAARVYKRELSEREMLCIELSENLKRKDFTPAEEVAIKKRIHDLHIAELGEKVARDKDAPGWSVTSTAKFLGETTANTSMDLKLARMIEEFPDLGWENLKTKKDCRDLMNKIGTFATRSTRVEEIERERQNGSVAQRVKTIMDAFLVGDFFEHAAKMDDATFNLIEIDPPYGIDLRKTKKGYGYGNDYNEIVHNKYPEFLSKTFREAYRLLKPNGWLVCWFGPEPWFEHVFKLLRDAHFVGHRMCGIWVKPSGQAQQPTTSLANCYEMFFYVRKGDARLQRPGRSNVYNFPPLHPSNKIHPTERPVDLMREILETFALPGDRLLVPFAGSGATLRAAFDVGLKPVGFDLSQSYKDAYVVRVMEDFQCQPEKKESD